MSAPLDALAPSAPGISATVMASAGTGKTWLLVTRLIRLLLAGVTPDAILAITFTRKAAAEMQARLAQRLRALAALDEALRASALSQLGVTPTPERVAAAGRLHERLLRGERNVRVTTFHAFCQEILRRFPLEADVPPGFEVLDSAGMIESEAWDALVAEATAQPDAPLSQDLQALYVQHGGHQGTRAALSSFLAHRSDWWAYTRGEADPVAYACRRLQTALDIDPHADPARAWFTPALEAALQEYGQLLARHPIEKHLHCAELISRALDERQDVPARQSAATQALLTQKNEPRALKASKALQNALGATGMERLLALHQQLCASVSELLDRQRRHRTYALSHAWFRAGTRLLEHYQRLKTERRVLDFSDLEWKAYLLINHADHAQWVQYKLDQRIEHLLIDEYQDTNPTQWHLILPLLEELASGDGERRRSVFLVGDAKQSIYRFRRANPRLFDAAADWLAARLGAGTYGLATSWRSAPAIMECVNRVFSADATQALPGFTPHATHHETLWGRVELLPLVQPPEPRQPAPRAALRNPLRMPRDVYVDDRFLREGRVIAATINALIAAPTYLGAAHEARAAGYSDVMLLVRSRTHVHHYERALREAGIPYIGANRGTLLESQEVIDLRALLNTLTVPYDNLALATVLRSPLFACSDEDLQHLARDSKTPPWWDRVMELGTSGNASAALARAARLLGRWQACAGTLPVHDLLDRIYCEGDVFARYEAAFPTHLRTRVRANLTRFLELALAVDSGRYPSLPYFLARLHDVQQLADEAPDEAPALRTAGAVRILTIHAAKGLEAPIVFLADATCVPVPRTAHGALVHWPAQADRPTRFLLLGRKAELDSWSAAQLQTDEQNEAREDLNLLYVALTRARQLLYVSGAAPRRGPELGWYGMIASRLAPEDAERAMREGMALERHAMPPAPAAVSPPVAAVTHPAPDPRLREPLVGKHEEVELAPSRIADGRLAAAGDEDGQARGVAIHRFLELLNGAPARDDVALRARVAHEVGMNARDPVLRDWYCEALAVVEAPELAHLFRPGRYIRAYDEVPMVYTFEGRRVHGVVDRIVVADDDIWVIDYKTHRAAHDRRALADLYSKQLEYYARGARRLWPHHHVRAALLFTANAQLLELHRDR